MDENRLLIPSSSAMEKQQHQLPPPPPSQLPLKCPRCDSSNTKFCYYNNYSLSQPRHFCKACKRYWTRGGTLRNVPVGGGCRKNKRVKRAPPPPVTTTSTTVTATDRQQVRPSSTVNPIFSPNNYLSSSGLGFSSAHFLPNNYSSSSDGIRCISASSGMIMGSSSTTNHTLPSMTSLLASTIQHQKFIGTGGDHLEQLKQYESAGGLAPMKNNNMEGQSYMMNNTGGGDGGWNLLGYQNHHQMEQLGLSSTDPVPNYYWGMSNVVTAGNNWHDPAANTESSVPSLI